MLATSERVELLERAEGLATNDFKIRCCRTISNLPI